MAVRIFHWETNAREEWLDVLDDRSVSYHIENSGWNLKKGLQERETRFTLAEAKAKWPSYAERLENAVRELKR